MKLPVILMLSLLLIEGCGAQTTRMPREMPEKITISLTESGGMTRAFKKIRIEDGVLEFEELKGGQPNSQKWSARISRGDLAQLYRVFVENRFDTIENDERRTIVYDAGSESISISLNKLKFYGVTYGKNSPLSGKNLARYRAVRGAIDELLGKYESAARPSFEAEKYLQGRWRVEGENGGRSRFLEWTFADGNFRQSGYPPLFQEGKYRVLNVDGDPS